MMSRCSVPDWGERSPTPLDLTLSAGAGVGCRDTTPAFRRFAEFVRPAEENRSSSHSPQGARAVQASVCRRKHARIMRRERLRDLHTRAFALWTGGPLSGWWYQLVAS